MAKFTASQGQGKVLARGDDQVRLGRQVFQQERQLLVNRHGLDQMVIVQHQDARGGQCGEILEELSRARQAAHFSLFMGDLAAAEEVVLSQRQLLDAADKPGAAALELRRLEFMLLQYQGELAQAIEGLQLLRTEAREAGELEAPVVSNAYLDRVCIWKEVGQDEELEATLQEWRDLCERGVVSGGGQIP